MSIRPPQNEAAFELRVSPDAETVGDVLDALADLLLDMADANARKPEATAGEPREANA